ncbi:MAG: 3-deoxy-manno-octulosonate cytidylyltransferase [Methyloceanibacter sp.]|nr:3-deoxy-manno-octulosonate cytidylyltransferase [Methyloceanibacter sp.]
MSACVIIPARYASSRYPGKPLVPLLGKPMIIWVSELSARAIGRDHVYVATDDTRIKQVVEDRGFRAIMTSSRALTGTDRIAEAAGSLDYDIFVNVQGDEPLVDPRSINDCIELKERNPECIINAYTELTDSEDPQNTNIPKVVTTEDGTLLYISRSVVPGHKTQDQRQVTYKKQVCIYGFDRTELHAYEHFGRKSECEAVEDIEILRFFELGRKIKMYPTPPGSLAVDAPEDVPIVEAALTSHWQK